MAKDALLPDNPLTSFDLDVFHEAAKHIMGRLPVRAHDMITLAREVDVMSEQAQADLAAIKQQMDEFCERWQALFDITNTVAQLIRAAATFTGNSDLWPSEDDQ